MTKPTVRDIHEVVISLQSLASSLRDAANGAPIEGQKTHMVGAQVSGLLEAAGSLDRHIATLKKLIPEDEVSVEPETAPET